MISDTQVIRQVRPTGNGAHVFLPRSWIGQEVAVAPRDTQLKERIMAVLLPHLETIVGIYLCGSHARNEAEPSSDIDVLVVANTPLRVSSPGFQIITIEENRFSTAIGIDPLLVYSLLAEAKPILNSELLLELRRTHKPRPIEFNDYLKSTKLIADVADEALADDSSEDCPGETAYPLLLRLRDRKSVV